MFRERYRRILKNLVVCTERWIYDEQAIISSVMARCSRIASQLETRYAHSPLPLLSTSSNSFRFSDHSLRDHFHPLFSCHHAWAVSKRENLVRNRVINGSGWNKVGRFVLIDSLPTCTISTARRPLLCSQRSREKVGNNDIHETFSSVKS